MASTGEDESHAVLSDAEANDEPVPVDFARDVSVERFRELLAELDREKQARLAAKNSKNDLQVLFNRLKALAHEAIKKRDESNRSKDEASREVEKLTSELGEAHRSREEISKQRDEIANQFDEAVKVKDSSRSETETAVQMLVSGIEKISGKANHIKNFTAVGLPMSPTYTRLPAVAYGVIKRTNEIVGELLKQIDLTTNSRNEAREQMEQRNYEIAIEVSQLESTIEQLKEEVSRKTAIIEDLEKLNSDKDGKLSCTGVLLRSALSKKITSEPTSKANKLFQVAENGLRDAKIDFKIAQLPSSSDQVAGELAVLEPVVAHLTKREGGFPQTTTSIRSEVDCK